MNRKTRGRAAPQLPAPPPSCERAATASTLSTGTFIQDYPVNSNLVLIILAFES